MNNYIPILFLNLEDIDKLLDTYNLQRLTQKETENLNRPTMSNEIESVILHLQPKELQYWTGLLLNSTKLLKRLIPIVLKLFQKIEGDGITPNSFDDASMTMISKPDKDTTKKKIQANILQAHRRK